MNWDRQAGDASAFAINMVAAADAEQSPTASLDQGTGRDVIDLLADYRTRGQALGQINSAIYARFEQEEIRTPAPHMEIHMQDGTVEKMRIEKR